MYYVHHPCRLKFPAILCLGLRHLCEHRFRHPNFEDNINPVCLCGTNAIETNEYFLLSYFKGRNFRGKKLLRFRKTAKYLHFAGINFPGNKLSR